eukprot:CAMPEP_0172684636 /NCGR_PEP_ID=MMETSP1074-20121228/19700_1 /TAXON_ID=2916 /ORGANISM="Ceratium fusus, Strain PA161109" /LENGTH=121 /DNA_ID=CAMNT_0013503681 /DNA_START=1178 /DNA_END=1543 /DNA_ORIENTATION=-
MVLGSSCECRTETACWAFLARMSRNRSLKQIVCARLAWGAVLAGCPATHAAKSARLTQLAARWPSGPSLVAPPTLRAIGAGGRLSGTSRTAPLAGRALHATAAGTISVGARPAKKAAVVVF